MRGRWTFSVIVKKNLTKPCQLDRLKKAHLPEIKFWKTELDISLKFNKSPFFMAMFLCQRNVITNQRSNPRNFKCVSRFTSFEILQSTKNKTKKAFKNDNYGYNFKLAMIVVFVWKVACTFSSLFAQTIISSWQTWTFDSNNVNMP